MKCKTCNMPFSSSEYMHVVIDRLVKYLPQEYCDLECFRTENKLKRMNTEESTVLKELANVEY